MTKLTFIAVLVLLASLAWSDAVDTLIAGFKEPDESIERAVVNASGDSYTLVSVNGVDMLLVENRVPIIVTGQSNIEAVLKTNYYETKNVDGRIANIRADVDFYDGSGAAAEAECMRLTGIDKYPCVDQPTCLFACRSVPICQSIGNTNEFLFEIKAYNETHTLFESKLKELKTCLNYIKNGASHADDCITKWNAVKTEATNINRNKLVDTCGACYNFCPRHNYSTAAANNITNGLNSLKTDLGSLPQVSEYASQLSQRTDERMNYINTREARWQSLSSRSSAELADLKHQYDELSDIVTDLQTGNALKELQNLSAYMASNANGGLYARAFEAETQFFNKAGSINSTMAEEREKYADLQKTLNETKVVVETLESMVPANHSLWQNVSSIRIKYTNLKVLCNPPVVSGDMPQMTHDLAELKGEAEDLITKAVLAGLTPNQNNAQQPQNNTILGNATIPLNITGGSPAFESVCPVGLVALASILGTGVFLQRR